MFSASSACEVTRFNLWLRRSAIVIAIIISNKNDKWCMLGIQVNISIDIPILWRCFHVQNQTSPTINHPHMSDVTQIEWYMVTNVWMSLIRAYTGLSYVTLQEWHQRFIQWWPSILKPNRLYWMLWKCVLETESAFGKLHFCTDVSLVLSLSPWLCPVLGILLCSEIM